MTNAVDPREKLQQFAALLGDWSSEATHPAFGDIVIPGRVRFEWFAGEHFLIQRTENEPPSSPTPSASSE